MRSRAFALAALLFALAGPPDAHAQKIGAHRVLPPMVFDDFQYTSANWVSPLATGTNGQENLFGINRWCKNTACTSSEQSRFWYLFSLTEQNHLRVQQNAQIVPTGAWDGRLRFELGSGLYYANPASYGTSPSDPGINPLQISSGFSAKEGAWAASIRVSALPSHTESAFARMMQSFWTYGSPVILNGRSASSSTIPDALGPFGPNDSPTRSKWAWSEMDFEYNNWFTDIDFVDDGSGPIPPQNGVPSLGQARRYMATGFFEDCYRQTQGSTVYTWGTPDFECDVVYEPGFKNRLKPSATSAASSAFECLYQDVDESQLSVRDGAFCAEMMTTYANRKRNLYLVIRNHDGLTRFQLSSHGWGGVMLMDSGWVDSGAAPSTQMRAFFSTYIFPPFGYDEGTDNGYTIDRSQNLEVDWFYYTPEHDRSSNDIFDDVVYVRGQPAGQNGGRLATTSFFSDTRVADPTLAGPVTGESGGYPTPTYLAEIDDVSVQDLRPGYRTITLDINVPFSLGAVFYRTRRAGGSYGPWTSTLVSGNNIDIPESLLYADLYVETRVYALEYTNGGALYNVVKNDPLAYDSNVLLLTPSGGFSIVGSEGPDAAAGPSQANLSGQKDKMSVYPNPASRELVVECGERDAGRATILLHDPLGREIMRVDEADSSERLDVSALTPSTYAATCAFGDTRESLRFVKLD